MPHRLYWLDKGKGKSKESICPIHTNFKTCLIKPGLKKKKKKKKKNRHGKMEHRFSHRIQKEIDMFCNLH